jgi:hypothetical protein
MGMHDFASSHDYVRFLCDRDVDRVMHFIAYDQRGTNEGAILKELAASPSSAVQRVGQGPDFQVYAVDRATCA